MQEQTKFHLTIKRCPDLNGDYSFDTWMERDIFIKCVELLHGKGTLTVPDELQGGDKMKKKTKKTKCKTKKKTKK